MNSPILPTRSQVSSGQVIKTSTQGSTLADILERVLDKGIVIAGDISVSIASTELLHIRIRLLIASVDKAKEMGINWWEGDPYLSSKAQSLIEENRELRGRLANLESQINLLTSDIAKISVEKPELLTVENNLNGDDNTQELSEEITPISVDQDELEQYTIVSERIPGNLQENTDYIGDFNQQDFVLEETETTQAVVELDDEIG